MSCIAILQLQQTICCQVYYMSSAHKIATYSIRLSARSAPPPRLGRRVAKRRVLVCMILVPWVMRKRVCSGM